MSLLLQIVLGVIVAGGIGFGVWNHSHNQAMNQQTPVTINDQTTTQPAAQAGVHADVNLSAGTTNADLNADMSAIDGQLKLVNDSSVDADKSMNDKPITQ